MKDVAAVAGVSVATVSRVVNGSDDVRRDRATRVRAAVEMLGYRQDLTASTLRRADRHSASIGVIIEDVSNPFFAAVYRGIEDIARTRGVLTFVGSSDEGPDRERELIEAFGARGVDGLIMVPVAGEHGHLARERERGTALVFVDRPPGAIDADTVVADNADGARTAVEHLVRAGHRRIGFLGDRPSVFTAAERLHGYREALAAAGIERLDALEHVGLVDAGSAQRAAAGLLDATEPPTALFAGQNLITLGAVRALRERGLQHEVAVVGFDDVLLGDLVDPGVTVVRQDPHALGRHAAELLFARLGGEDGPARRVVVPTELVARGSGEIDRR